MSLSIHTVVTGNDATRTAIGWGIDALTQVSELRARWIADFDGVTPTAVEEIVRWASPVIVMRRTLAGAATLGGQEPNAGDKVLILYWADNRDFMRQDQLNLMRKPNPHMGFIARAEAASVIACHPIPGQGSDVTRRARCVESLSRTN